MPTLTPDELDHAAARIVAAGPVLPVDEGVWAGIVSGWERTAPADRTARTLLTKTVDELVAEAVAAMPVDLPVERALPGRLGAMLPDRLHAWRRIGQADCKPSVQLGVAAQVLESWGWQNTPYRLRDARGARCVCGAILAAERLGYGSRDTADTSAALVLTHLRRHEGWAGLIGPWNRAPGRTAGQAVGVLITAGRDAAAHGM